MRLSGLLLVVLACLGSVGCGKRVVVSGKVLDRGIPLARAELRWLDESETVFVSGVTDENGVYRLESSGKPDIPAGKYKVTVVWWRTPNGKPLPEGEAGTALKAKSTQMNAELAIEVTQATNSLDLDVTGRGTVVPN